MLQLTIAFLRNKRQTMNIEDMQVNAEDAAKLLKILANPTRLLILCALIDREHSAGELEEIVELSQSAVSQHLAKLREQDIVNTRRERQSILYKLSDSNSNSKAIIETLHRIYCGS